MKLASLNYGRNGKLIVVSDDLKTYANANPFAASMQIALDDWPAKEPGLKALARGLVKGDIKFKPFQESLVSSPLPRAYQWADGSAYVNHVELVRKARGADMPESFWTDPLMYQGGSDAFLGPQDPIPFVDPAWGLDFEAEVAVIIGDVAQGADKDTCAKAIRLVMLVNDVSLRGLIPGELAKGFGFFQSKPASAFSPLAVSPDSLGEAWREGKLHRPIRVRLNDEVVGQADAGVDMTFDFPTLIAHAAKTRDLAAGTIIGSGTVSNKGEDGGPGKPVKDGGKGYSCLAEVRTVETLLHGEPKTPFLQPGDRVQIDMLDDDGASIFGTIDQTVVKVN
ncbi:MAG: fumarylacetoacetate hydrolase family protein [Maricaulaceae bacterium]